MNNQTQHTTLLAKTAAVVSSSTAATTPTSSNSKLSSPNYPFGKRSSVAVTVTVAIAAAMLALVTKTTTTTTTITMKSAWMGSSRRSFVGIVHAFSLSNNYNRSPNMRLTRHLGASNSLLTSSSSSTSSSSQSHRLRMSTTTESSSTPTTPPSKVVGAVLPRVKAVDAKSPTDGPVVVKGWVRTVRKQKTLAFVEVNDGSNLSGLQCVLSFDVIDDETKSGRCLHRSGTKLC
jgi:hypothetical protein